MISGVLLDRPRGGARNGITFVRALQLAARELRSGLGGFHVFIACVALGVMVIMTVGTLSDALKSGLERQGEMILGGDVTLSRMHTRAEGEERAWLAAQGRMSETATLRTMARRMDGEDQALIEFKGIDSAYPLVGKVQLNGGVEVDPAVRKSPGVLADPILLERLGLKAGDSIKIGDKTLTIAGTIKAEPDGLADRLTYGPRVMASLDTLVSTGLVQPGSLVRWRYALKLPQVRSSGDEQLKAFLDTAKSRLGSAGYTITDRTNPSPQVKRTLERLRQFLTLLGLTSLLVGGVGVANAVATFIDRRRKVIATMKSLGATSRLVFTLFLTQIVLMAGIGIVIGLLAGLLVPLGLSAAYGELLPVEANLTLSSTSVIVAAAYGLFVALLFALWPLGRAERISPSVLFRDEVAPDRARPRPAILVALAAIAAALLGFAVFSSDAPHIAFYFCAAVIGVFALFIALGEAITRVAKRMRRPRRPELALAIANLGAPGGLTRSVVLSLGAGLSLLVAVALADSSLVYELQGKMPAESPNYFVLDIRKDEYPGLKDLVLAQVPGSKLEDAPMLRGRLVSLNGIAAEDKRAPAEAQWVLNGDRGLTYSEVVPAGSKVSAGEWWPKDYGGEPLVSFEAELASKLGLKIGDSVTVNVLGRNLTAKISNLREVHWENLSLNFVMVFSPNTLKNAPHNLLATITLPQSATLETEAKLARTLGQAYPTVTAIRVKDALEAFNAVFSKVMVAVRIGSGVTLVAGALVLAGALMTAQRRRILEAVILKVLGATRIRILKAHFAEYVLLATLTTACAVVLGTLAAWAAVRFVMEIDFTFSWSAVLTALALATGLVLLFGGIGTWGVLKARPVPYLRSE